VRRVLLCPIYKATAAIPLSIKGGEGPIITITITETGGSIEADKIKVPNRRKSRIKSDFLSVGYFLLLSA
jgi:hypothetical protein